MNPHTDTLTDAARANEFKSRLGNDYALADAFDPEYLETPAEPLSPEQQLRNVAGVMMRHSEVVRTHNGRGRCSTYAANTDALAQTGRQLAEMVLAYLAGGTETTRAAAEYKSRDVTFAEACEEASLDDCKHCDNTGEVRHLNDETDYGPCPHCQPEPEPSQAEIDECWDANRRKLLRAEMWGLI